MNKYIKRFISLAAVSLLSTVLPGGSQASETLLPSIYISGILTNPQGGFLLLLEASNPACGSSGNQFNVWIGTSAGRMSAEGAQGALAAVLTAYAMGKPIKVYFDPSIPGCPVSQIWLTP